MAGAIATKLHHRERKQSQGHASQSSDTVSAMSDVSTFDETEYDRVKEIGALLEADQTTLGDVWRRRQEGKTPEQIAEEDGNTVGPAYSYFNLQNALLNGTVSQDPSVARGVAARIRRWLKTKPLRSCLKTSRQASRLGPRILRR